MDRIVLNELYTEKWFRLRPRLAWRVEPFCDSVWSALGPFKSLVDVGCAIGEFVAHFHHRHNVFAIGFDGSENCLMHMAPGATIYIHDLRAPLDWGSPKFDLCMCLEVAEHLEPEYADTLIDSITSLSSMVLFTAATPNQLGTGHVNLQPREYWYEKFAVRGYEYLPDKVEELRQKLFSKYDGKGQIWGKKGIRAYYDNAMVFRWKSQSPLADGQKS